MTLLIAINSPAPRRRVGLTTRRRYKCDSNKEERTAGTAAMTRMNGSSPVSATVRASALGSWSQVGASRKSRQGSLTSGEPTGKSCRRSFL